MKYNTYIAIGISAFTLVFGGCSDKDDGLDSEYGTRIEGVALSMESAETAAKIETKAVVGGVTYVVNTASDPTSKNSSTGTIDARGTNSWKLDFTLYNGKDGSGNVATTSYADGSFTGGQYVTVGADKYWKPSTDKYFPNYKNPHAELYLYPNTVDASVELDQSDASKLLKQDILYKSKGQITIAHITTVALSHKRAMLDFIISDIVPGDIQSVTVSVDSKSYNPYKVKETTTSREYLLILPEATAATIKPVVKIVTNPNATTGSSSIHYSQNIDLISSGTLGSNNCYCFTLQGNLLSLSPVTIVDWTTGEPVTGQYVAVTAYPTFKGPSTSANQTYYLYYDNKLTDGAGKAKLQAITFNDKSECTIKPDGRIITHIVKNESDYDPLKPLTSPIPLDKMLIDLIAVIDGLP